MCALTGGTFCLKIFTTIYLILELVSFAQGLNFIFKKKKKTKDIKEKNYVRKKDVKLNLPHMSLT